MERDRPVVMRTEEHEKAVFVVLEAIAGQPELRDMLFLKGAYATEGHTGLHRSTEDVDFTATQDLCQPELEGEERLQEQFRRAIEDFLDLSEGEWSLLLVNVKRKPSSSPHPRGWDSFRVTIRLQARSRTRHIVKLDITPEQPPISTVEFSCDSGAIAPVQESTVYTLKSYSGRMIDLVMLGISDMQGTGCGPRHILGEEGAKDT